MKTKTVWLTALLLLLAAGLRIWNVGDQSLWFDEGFSWHAASQPTLLTVLNGDPTNPPLYYLLLHIWIRLTGDSEFSLRMFSVMQGLALLAGTGAMTRLWFGRRAGAGVVALGAFVPLLWWASQEARMYNTLAAAVLVASAGFIEVTVTRRNPRRGWLLLLAGEVAALYTHNTGIVVLGGLNAAFLIVWASKAIIEKHSGWRLIRSWIIVQSIVLVAWIPEVLARFRNLSNANAATRNPPEISIQMLWQAWEALWASSWEMVLAQPQSLTLAAVAMLPLLILAFWVLKKPQGRALAVLLIMLFTVLIAALGVLGVNFHARYIVMLTPLLLIITAGGTSMLGSQHTTTVAQVAVVAGTAAVWWLIPGHPTAVYQHDQAREMVSYYARHLDSHDLVLTWSYAERYELQYYAWRANLQARIITLSDGATADAVAAAINSHLQPDVPVRAEINTWYTQGSDARGMLRCLLGNGAPNPQQSHAVVGMTSTAYTLTNPLEIPRAQTTEPALVGPVVLINRTLPYHTTQADHGFCLPLTFGIDSPVSDPLTVAVRILTPSGHEIASADAPILTDTQTSAEHLTPGDSATAYPLMYLPHGTPPGNYTVTARVYSADRPSGYDVRDAVTGTPQGKDLVLGTLAVSAADWDAFEGDCNLALSPSVRLTNCADLSATSDLQAGQALPLTFAWQLASDRSRITIRLEGIDWQTEDTALLQGSGATLDWRTLPVPPDASGRAALVAQADDAPAVILAEYTVQSPEHLMQRPAVGHTIEQWLPGIGILYGFTLEDTTIISGTPFTLTLVWQAEAATTVPLKVTVQLLDSGGRLLAQHDAAPSNGARPTTGWVPGEYITDVHVVEFGENAGGYAGPAMLIAALYDPADGTRQQTENGETTILLHGGLSVQTR